MVSKARSRLTCSSRRALDKILWPGPERRAARSGCAVYIDARPGRVLRSEARAKGVTRARRIGSRPATQQPSQHASKDQGQCPPERFSVCTHGLHIVWPDQTGKKKTGVGSAVSLSEGSTVSFPTFHARGFSCSNCSTIQ